MTSSPAINSLCPWSGDTVSDDSLAGYRGRIVGFCNPGCRDKFARATSIFDQLIEASPSSMRTGFVRLAAYNQWFNQALYNAAERLSEFDYRKDAGAFFNSVHGTLNHIMVWDVTWLKRFRTHTIKYPSLDRIETYTTPTSHDEILFDEHQQLRQARIDIDQIIKDFVTETREADYETVFSYTISTGETFNKNFGGMVQHLFNHQTHHRGQVTVLMSQMGIDPGVTDLLARLPEEEHNGSNTL